MIGERLEKNAESSVVSGVMRNVSIIATILVTIIMVIIHILVTIMLIPITTIPTPVIEVVGIQGYMLVLVIPGNSGNIQYLSTS